MPRLIAQLRTTLRLRHYSRRTEQAYVGWVRRFVHFCELRHPTACNEQDVRRFLAHLAEQRQVSASTQNQALAALIFLYRDVLKQPLDALPNEVRSKRGVHVPNVLTPDEVTLVVSHLHGVIRELVALMYGAGLRLEEALSLRIKDVDLQRRTVTVRSGKGGKDRRTVLPEALVDTLRRRIDESRRLHLRDVLSGGGHIPLPTALGRKLPGARLDWRWSWVFPAGRTFKARRTGEAACAARSMRFRLRGAVMPSCQTPSSVSCDYTHFSLRERLSRRDMAAFNTVTDKDLAESGQRRPHVVR